MFRKKPVITYETKYPEILPNPLVSSKTQIPEWYKKIPKWIDGKPFTLGQGINNTLKQCVPFMEAMTNGYMILSPYDLYVTRNGDVPYLVWITGLEFPPDVRDKVADPNIVPAGHAPFEYAWRFGTSIKIPKGYSCLLTHPLNRHDLPFTTLSGIIDGEFVTRHSGNVPFYLKENFEGLIPMGTPIAQLILFRQENWKSAQEDGLLKIGDNPHPTHLFSGWYKDRFWKRKSYE